MSITCYGQKKSGWSMEIGFKPQLTIPQKSDLIDPHPKANLGAYILPTWHLTEQVDILFPIGYRSIAIDYTDYRLTFGCDVDGMGNVDYRSSYLEYQDQIGIFNVGLGARLRLLDHYYIQATASVFAITNIQHKRYDEYACGQKLDPVALSCECVEEDFTSRQFMTSISIGRKTRLSKRLALQTGVEYSRFIPSYQSTYVVTSAPTFEDINIGQVGLSIGVQYRFGIE